MMQQINKLEYRVWIKGEKLHMEALNCTSHQQEYNLI